MAYSHASDYPADILARAAKIRLACFDVDGTLTDGRLLLDDDGRLLGLYTDGDLRRTLADPSIDVHAARIADVMTRAPVAIGANALASEAARLMEDRKITMLVVLDDERRVVGALNIHDLLRARVV
jgi:arabinose-5-phosphate isomerase